MLFIKLWAYFKAFLSVVLMGLLFLFLLEILLYCIFIITQEKKNMFLIFVIFFSFTYGLLRKREANF